MKTGIELIAEERLRQIEKEGWTSEHDINHGNEALSCAAACYATPDRSRRFVAHGDGIIPRMWPFDAEWWKPSPDNRIKELVKAGALIAAEIDRLQRAKK